VAGEFDADLGGGFPGVGDRHAQAGELLRVAVVADVHELAGESVEARQGRPVRVAETAGGGDRQRCGQVLVAGVDEVAAFAVARAGRPVRLGGLDLGTSRWRSSVQGNAGRGGPPAAVEAAG
jgi:hypothetical protein